MAWRHPRRIWRIFRYEKFRHTHAHTPSLSLRIPAFCSVLHLIFLQVTVCLCVVLCLFRCYYTMHDSYPLPPYLPPSRPSFPPTLQVYDPRTMQELKEDDVDPFYVPDNMRTGCNLCGVKFQLVVRGRHHCR